MIISRSSGRQVLVNHLDMDGFQEARFLPIDRISTPRNHDKYCRFSYPQLHQPIIMTATSARFKSQCTHCQCGFPA
jgi:hypothetical protein